MPAIAPVSFARISGPYEYDDRLPTKASTAIAVGDVLDCPSTGLQGADAGDSVVALALQAKAVGDATQDSILTLLLFGERQKFYGIAEAGAFDREDDGGQTRDLNSPDGIAANTSSQNDWLVLYVLDADEAVGRFVNLKAVA